MTFLEAAIAVLRQAGRPLPVRKLTELAIKQNLLSHVGREPEETMQARLDAETRKATGHSEILRIADGVYGLKTYPKMEEAASGEADTAIADAPEASTAEVVGAESDAASTTGRSGRRRRSRRGRGRGRGAEESAHAGSSAGEAQAEAAPGIVELAPLPAELDFGAESAPAESAAAGEPREEAAVDVGSPSESPQDGTPADDVVPGDDLAEAQEPFLAHGIDELERDAEVERGPAVPEHADRAHERDAQRRRRGRGRGRAGSAEGEPGPPADRSTRGRQTGLADAGYEVLRAKGDSTPIHFRQLTEMAIARGLLRGDGGEPWRAMRAALLVDGRERQGGGLRPRVRHQGGGLFVLASARLEPELSAVEASVIDRVTTLRRETRAALQRRIARLPPASFDHLARVLAERLGYGGLVSVGRGPGGVSLSTGSILRGPLRKKALIAVRAGGELSRSTLRELRDEAARRALHEVAVLTTGKVEEDVRDNPLPGVEIFDGESLADLCARLGIGVLRAQLEIEYLDPEFFAEMGDGQG